MSTAQRNLSFVGFDESFNANESQVTFTGTVKVVKTVPANSALNSGTMTNKTDADTGVVTLQTGHTIVTSGALVDVYWTDTGVAKSRHGLTATKSTNDITLEGGAGDDLPANATPVIVCAQTAIEINFDGDTAQVVAVFYRNASDTGALGLLDLKDSGPATIKLVSLKHEAANGGLTNIWQIANGDANAFTGNRIVAGYVSHDSTSAGVVYILVGINS